MILQLHQNGVKLKYVKKVLQFIRCKFSSYNIAFDHEAVHSCLYLQIQLAIDSVVKPSLMAASYVNLHEWRLMYNDQHHSVE